MNKLGIMHIVSDLNIGGGQAVVRTLAEYQARQGCTPVVCAFQDGPLGREIKQAGIPVEILPGRRAGIFAFPYFVVDMAHILRQLSTLVKRYNIQVVQTHLLMALDFLVLALRWTNPGVVIFWTFHSANFVLRKEHLARQKWLLGPKRFVHRQLYRLTAPCVEGFIAVSDQVRESLLQVFGERIRPRIYVLPNGVDVERYGIAIDRAAVRAALGLPADSRILIQVGALKPVKGHTYTIAALAALAERYPDLHALFVGDGELRTELEAQVAANGLTGRAHFLGNRRDIPTLLAASDLFVLPSLWEGLSMALLEAMASGLPVVASAVSGTIQVIIPNETGYLFPPGDVTAFTQAVDMLLVNPAYAQALGEAARRRVVAEFSAQRQAEAHLALYRQALYTLERAEKPFHRQDAKHF